MKNPWSLGARFLLNRNLRRAPSGCPPQWLKAGIRFLILHRCWFRSGKKNETQTHFSPLLPSTQQLFIKHNCWGRRRRRCVHNAALESLEAATSGRKNLTVTAHFPLPFIFMIGLWSGVIWHDNPRNRLNQLMKKEEAVRAEGCLKGSLFFSLSLSFFYPYSLFLSALSGSFGTASTDPIRP